MMAMSQSDLLRLLVFALPLALFVLVPLVVAWVIWSRYLYHKETMKLAEMGGNARDALELRERWRVRWGLLVGAGVISIGVVIAGVLVLFIGMQASGAAAPARTGTFAQPSSPGTFVQPLREVSSGAGGLERYVDPPFLALLGAFCLFAVIVGAVIVAAYRSWGRKGGAMLPGEAAQEGEPMTSQVGDRWRTRYGMLSGVAIVIMGAGIVGLVPAAEELLPTALDPEHYLGLAGFLVIALGLTMLIAHGIWSRQDRRAAAREEGAAEPEERTE
jgi:hypothetical protein